MTEEEILLAIKEMGDSQIAKMIFELLEITASAKESVESLTDSLKMMNEAFDMLQEMYDDVNRRYESIISG